jgi:predicted deacylase
VRSALNGYLDLSGLEASWNAVADRGGADVMVVGHSVEGRPLRAFGFGPRQGPSILLTGLIHGDELIGGLALLETVRRIVDGARSFLDEARVTVMPIVNPDGVRRTFARMRQGLRSGCRKNARGVDLNRNFGIVAKGIFRHPFAGSRRIWAPHYMGAQPFSEPETRAVRRLARLVRPRLSLGFHSFGNLLLYPWAFTRDPSRYADEYVRLAEAFTANQSRPYKVSQSCAWYPTLGDLDDWLEAEFDVRAMTVEVSKPDRALLRSFGLFEPIRWMNPRNISGTLENVAPGVLALLAATLV